MTDAASSSARRQGVAGRLGLPSRGDLLLDAVAGATVGASQVGNAMAYAMLAGVPPVHGLYAVSAGTPTGALTGSFQRMPIVPTAALCLAAGGALARDGEGLPREPEAPAALLSGTVTVLGIYGSLFFAAAPKALAACHDACSLPGRRAAPSRHGTLHNVMIALVGDYAAECAAADGRLYVAGVGPRMQEQLRRTGVRELGPDAMVTATEELYGACAVVQQRGETWLEARADTRQQALRSRGAVFASASRSSRSREVTPCRRS